MSYDSREDTLNHIKNVQSKILRVVQELMFRSINQDASKLLPPEKEVYDKYTPLLQNTEYGSERYKQLLAEMSSGVKHHWTTNSHHPEFYPNGIDGMNLLDLLEMFCDWKAASERHATGDLRKSIRINADRFKMTPQLEEIFNNTVTYLGWDKNESDS